jgi:Leucine-rich repeat (LRR) protein
MSFDLNVKVKTNISTKEWQSELRKHFIDFTFGTSIDREKHSGFLPVQWTDDFDETVDSGYELSFDKRKGDVAEYFFSSASSGNEFVAAWMSAAILTLLGKGTLTDPQEGKSLNGDAAVKQALDVLSAHKEQLKSDRLARQATAAPPVAIEISDEDLDVLFNWLVSKKIVKDLKTKKGRFDKISSLRIFEPKLVKVGPIPVQLKYLKNLEVFDLSFQKYRTLPEWIGELTNLKSLLANSNELSSLPSGLFQLRHLEELNLSLNKLEELPGEIGQLKSLKNLNVSQNAIRNIPVSIGELPKLEKLDVIINKITTLPESLVQCSSLGDLRLSGNPLVELPGWIGEMKQLKFLFVQSCGLKRLPESLGALSSLTYLGAAYNLLEEIPVSIGNLIQLRRIEASNNQLKTLPGSMVRLQNLESLDLSHNRQLRLTNDIENLLSLKELRVSSGAITSGLQKRLEDKQPMCWTSFD